MTIAVPTSWETLDPDADAALTRVAARVRDEVAAAGADAAAARRALADLHRGWQEVAARFGEGALDTDVRECVGAFFDELAALKGLDGEALWSECILGLVDGPPPAPLADLLRARGHDPAWDEALAAALEVALPLGPVELPGVGALVVRHRPARPGTLHASPPARIRALAAGEQVGMPARTAVQLRPARGLAAALQGAAALEAPWSPPLRDAWREAAALGEAEADGAAAEVLGVLLAGLAPSDGRVEVGGALVFVRRDRPATTGRNPSTGQEIVVPGRPGLAVHARTAFKERLAARMTPAADGPADPG